MKVDESKPFLFPTIPTNEGVISITALDESNPKENGELTKGIVFSDSDVRLVLEEESDSSVQESPELDPWKLPEISLDEGPKWKDLNNWERFRTVAVGFGKFLGLLALLYLFICSLGLLSDSFRLLGGRAAGEIFRDSQMLHNPICGLMLGILATVLLQSSSTSTSIVVSMVASDILTVRMAIPIVMGANIGTSLTNTLVSVAHSSKRAEFRRAFAGATVHDMFNWLCVIILLPLEVASGYLYRVSGFVISKLALNQQDKGSKPPKLLKVLTDPLTKRIIQLDKSKIKAIAVGKLNDDPDEDFTLVKRFCGKLSENVTTNLTDFDEEQKIPTCGHMFASSTMKDSYIGLILLLVSLAALIFCLVFIVKILNSLLKGKIASAIRKTINNDFPGCFSFLTGYAAIVLGAIMTILVQSSSVFTSTLTPLVGIGILSLDRMYPLTLGSNVGTTFTSVLAAMASPPENLGPALQIALCHLFFNISGIILFFPIPITRKAPIALAKMLGNKTAKYRWVAVLYVAVMFFLIPGAIFGLSMAGPKVLMGVGGPFLIIFFGITFVNVLQSQCPKCLPRFLQNWRFLPEWMHSCKPLDGLLMRMGEAIQNMCPFCTSGWSLCFQSPDTAAQAPNMDHHGRYHESRKNLLLATSPGNSTFPSQAPTRSNSPTGGRRNRLDDRTPL